jgi:predicted regulator of amino acid metabolism with ACT domain
MPKADQDNVIAGVNIAQIIKENYTKGEDAVVSLIVDKTGIPKDVVEQGILTIAKDAGINTTSVQSYLDTIADKIQAGITDNHWNALWENVAKFAASFLSDGKLNWVTLGMGVIQFALQAIVKK